jgi:hypothetical protein
VLGTDWQTISALATAAGTLVLAVATFSAVRSSNRSARVAEHALLAGLRPLLVASLADDPPQKVLWSDMHAIRLNGGRAYAEVNGSVIYLAAGLRNVGSGIALLHGWSPIAGRALAPQEPAPVDEFRRLIVDLYIAPGNAGFWESAIRDESDPMHAELRQRIAERKEFTIDVLYGDQDGGQRTISRVFIVPASDDGWYCQIARHWNVDLPAPR